MRRPRGDAPRFYRFQPALVAAVKSEVKSARLPLVRQLLQHGFDVNVAVARGSTFEGQTALHEAVNQNDPAIAQLLIEAGADVNAQDAEGNTPLHVATRKDAAAFAELLVAHGADVAKTNARGETAVAQQKPKNNALATTARHRLGTAAVKPRQLDF